MKFGTYEFVQISPVCDQNDLQIMYGEALSYGLFLLKPIRSAMLGATLINYIKLCH